MLRCDRCGKEAVVLLVPIRQADIDVKGACSDCKMDLKREMRQSSETCRLPEEQLVRAFDAAESEIVDYLQKG